MSQPNGKRTTKAEVELRVTAVYEKLVSGMSGRQIAVWGGEQWNVSARGVNLYIAKATERLKADAQRHREAELGKSIARLDMLFAKTVEKKRWRDALAVEHERIELLGLRESSDDDHSSVDEFLALMKGGKS